MDLWGGLLPIHSNRRLSSSLFFNRNRVRCVLGHALQLRAARQECRNGKVGKLLCNNHLPKSGVPVIIFCSPPKGRRGAFGFTETRIWVDVSVSSSISRIARAPGIYSDAIAVVRQGKSVGLFPLQESCQLSRNPCFPATLRRPPGHLLRVGTGTSAKQG